MTDRPQRPTIRRHGEAPDGGDGHNGPQGAASGPTDAAPGGIGQTGPTGPSGAPGADAQAELDRLTEELETARTGAAELLAALQRERAEFQNFRRRTADEREREAGLAGDYLLKKVISIADDFDRAIEARPADLAGDAWAEGVGAIDRKLRGLLESEGVRPIEAVGRPFDPREHEAITSIPSTGRPDGEVIAEVQRGYRIRNRILRPALVAVAAGAPGDAAAGGPGHAPSAKESPTTHDHTERSN